MEEAYYLSHNKIDEDIIEVNIIINNEIKKLSCKYLVGADGGNSKLRRNIDNDYKLKYMFACKQNVYEGKINIDKDKYYFIKNDDFSDFFSWFNIENDNIYIGSIYFLQNKNKNYTDKLKTHLEKTFGLKIEKKIRSEICMSDSRLGEERYNFGNKNIIFIGEASGLIYNLGEGIPSAVISGELGALSIIESIETKTRCAEIYKNKIQPEKEYSRSGSNVW
jgi:flavin-dependent dehydrogenase